MMNKNGYYSQISQPNTLTKSSSQIKSSKLLSASPSVLSTKQSQLDFSTRSIYGAVPYGGCQLNDRQNSLSGQLNADLKVFSQRPTQMSQTRLPTEVTYKMKFDTVTPNPGDQVPRSKSQHRNMFSPTV